MSLIILHIPPEHEQAFEDAKKICETLGFEIKVELLERKNNFLEYKVNAEQDKALFYLGQNFQINLVLDRVK